ncbi:Thioredoxin reductase [Nakamurella panacisegetis]|uniref:Thioredoxin reductase n=1 Tax=Nakamurella panacisegetis TaxID=1090615 RepID=A0A1H0S8G1_9ACTN|nr:NAD(P)/FAD-dependent oxidoreductase [Nakamurella panacisegetis]SDP37496.1 Thioredoxin reductase [Nakamurella panacisegetis]
MPTSPADAEASGPFDVAVLGGGPAGMAAAGAAARAGARVALIDAAARTGGQYWRHRADDDGSHHTGWPTYQRLSRQLHEYQALVRHLPGQQVWQVETLPDGTFRVNTRADSGLRTLLARRVVVATGAYDRQLPFPGWTLPGVFTAGAAQALVKGHGVRPGSRIAVAGTGPFLLAVAAGLAEAGARVVGVFEAGGAPTAFARHPLAVLGNPAKLAEGAHYARILARHRIPYRLHTAVVAAHGDGDVTGVRVARLDRAWEVVAGTERTLEVDTLAVGYGFTPQLELAVQLGCRTRVDQDGSLVADVDDRQRSSRPGVFLAGEATGIGGAALAVVEGKIAGREAAADLGFAAATDLTRLRRRRTAQRRFAAALALAYPVRPGWMSWSDRNTIVCRCEEVTRGTIDDAVTHLGAGDSRAVKLYARPGMGLCQGRVCGYATSCLVAHAAGGTPSTSDLQGVAGRPIAAPITLGELAAQHHRRSDPAPESARESEPEKKDSH